MLSKIIITAKEKVTLSSGKLLDDIAGYNIFNSKEIIDATCQFLQKPNTSLDILVYDHNFDEKESKFLKTLKEQSQDFKGVLKLHIRKSEYDFSSIQLPHFIYNDNGSYRVEQNKPKDSPHAIGQAKNYTMTKFLQETFTDFLIKKEVFNNTIIIGN